MITNIQKQSDSQTITGLALDNFYYLKNELEFRKIILNKINGVQSICEEERFQSIKEVLSDFLLYGNKYDLRNLPVLEFLKQNDHYIPINQEINVFFSINHFSLAEEYIRWNYEKLKKSFHQNYIVFNELDTDELGTDIFEYQLYVEIVYGRKVSSSQIYRVPISYKTRENNYLLYKYFKDDISFAFSTFCGQDFYYGICHNLAWTYLSKILIDLRSKGDKENFSKIEKNYVLQSFNLKGNNELEQPLREMSFLKNVFLELFSKNFAFPLKNYYDIVVKLEFNIRENLQPSIETTDNLFSNTFFANLNYLRNIPKKNRKMNPIYQHDLELFRTFLKSYYKFNMEEYFIILNAMFNRVIEGASFFKNLQINNVCSFYHYYKSGEVISLNEENISLEDIKKYNTRHFFEIRNLLGVLKKESTEKAIKYLDFFGYVFLKRMLIERIDINTIEQIYDHKFLSEQSKKYFLQIIGNDLETLYTNSKDIKGILVTYDYLVEGSFLKLTLKNIVKRVKACEYILFPNNIIIKENLLLLDFVSKGEPINDKIEGIKLYNEYRYREKSSIPDIKGILYDFTYETVDMHSPEIISNGVGHYLHSNGGVSSSCLTPAGKAASCLVHGAMNENGRFFKICYNNKIIAYSWLWRAGDVLCFDNIEVTKEFEKHDNMEKIIMEIYKIASKKFIDISAENEKRGIKVVIIGKNELDIIQKSFLSLKSVKEYRSDLFKPNNSANLYLKDSETNQFILAGLVTDDILTQDRPAKYKYLRKATKKFQEYSLNDLNAAINSIYFDYCLYSNNKYVFKKANYKTGIIGEDWYVGFYSKGTYDFCYRKYSDDIIKEASQYITISKNDIKIPSILGKYDDIEYFLDKKNYSYDVESVQEYLNSLKEKMQSITINDFFHTTRSIKKLGMILYDKAITSSYFGKHEGRGGSNGEHFICIAELSSELYQTLSISEGFIIDENICTFKTDQNYEYDFKNSRYPLRVVGHLGERQVLDYISLDFVKAISVKRVPINIGMICYLQERAGTHLPMVLSEHFEFIDEKEIKRLIRIR